MLLYETGQRWSSVLRRTLEPRGVRVVQAGSLAACARQLMAGESRLAAIETRPEQLPGVLELAARASRFAAPAGVVVLAGRELASLEDAMLEAGVLYCEFSPRNYRRLGDFAARWLACYGKKEKEMAEEAELLGPMALPAALAEVMAGWNAEYAARER